MPDETVQPAAETSSAPVGVPVETGEVARVDSMIDDFLGDPGVVVDEPARQPERRQEQRSGDEPVPHENPEAQQPEPRNEPAAQRPQNDVVQRLLDQNAELMRMLAERTGKPQEPAAPKSPSADEQRDAVIKQLQDDMGLSAEDAAKHYSIIEKVAEMKAAPALEAARAQQQTREEAERRETDRLAHAEATRIIGENESILGKADVPFASLTKEQQQARQEFILTFQDLWAAQKSRGVQPDVKALIGRAFRAVAGDDTAMSRARQELSRSHEVARSRRTVPTTASRNGTTTPQMVRRGNMTLSAVEAAETDAQIDRFLRESGV
jgi:hypothetical protein